MDARDSACDKNGNRAIARLYGALITVQLQGFPRDFPDCMGSLRVLARDSAEKLAMQLHG